ncbi:MAG: CbiX/SirB N-terminal domain-containing protein [Armatimonadota bacterium]|nr:CbiX/SirB N-terminal domain-containing protein [Armatimonadota bacterium]
MNRTLLVWAMALAFTLAVEVHAQPQQPSGKKSTTIVLVGHGAPARDFPRDKIQRMIQLDRQIHLAGGEEKASADLVQEFRALEQECRQHPRTPENDPYDAAVKAVAKELEKLSGYRVIVSHNEFCGLDVPEAIEEAVRSGAKRVIVLSMMMTQGGGHSERDIPEKVQKARQKHPHVEVVYAWPYQHRLLASLLLQQVHAFTEKAN